MENTNKTAGALTFEDIRRAVESVQGVPWKAFRGQASIQLSEYAPTDAWYSLDTQIGNLYADWVTPLGNKRYLIVIHPDSFKQFPQGLLVMPRDDLAALMAYTADEQWKREQAERRRVADV